ncbi:hypothetical protein SRS16P2_00177 (plasmid) [Variovorax sp. SRS16]|uniref:DUF7281 domain-containing protein n=1 Tax=Variovorax sp. SRS16 TaxID=282217 RepID=UPI001315CD85|nr:hypothetical protein [Variovorax sp. SRS16]VTU45497.1 hypothetical protein SRS16P2_00177 [Variovorax sp. SRS16]
MNANVVSFLRRLVADRALVRSRGSTALAIADAEGIGQVRTSSVTYTEQDHVKAANLLASRGYALAKPEALAPRSDAVGADSEKSNALRVTDDMVAVVPIGIPGVECPRAAFLAMAAPAAAALRFEVLVVCENLEPMRRLHEYTWLGGLLRGRPALAVFRGSPGFFRVDVASRFVKGDIRPTLAFFDFDPKGLSMAASLPRREALCLPSLNDLVLETRKQRRAILFTNSAAASRPHLDLLVDPAIKAAWEAMKLIGYGLGQENFPR